MYSKSEIKNGAGSCAACELDEPPKNLLKEFYDPEKERYGVPQGGALSPVIANIILHQADKDILEAYGNRSRDELFYARYCDDMIIVHPDKEVCQSLLEVYVQSLFKMKLLVHEPKEFKKYDKNFYKEKSKKAYPWAAPSSDRCTAPWVSFVGYQVSHEGSLRIRDASIEKEIEKQKKIATFTIRSIKKKNIKTEKSAKQIIYRLNSKLSSMAAGKRYKNSIGPCEDMCWGNGFKLLINNPFVGHQISKLDRSREKAVRSVRYALHRQGVPPTSGALGSEKSKRNTILYFGFPFSYRGAFNKKL